MIGVTAFGLIFTPVFYVVCRWIALRAERKRPPRRRRIRPSRLRQTGALGALRRPTFTQS